MNYKPSSETLTETLVSNPHLKCGKKKIHKKIGKYTKSIKATAMHCGHPITNATHPLVCVRDFARQASQVLSLLTAWDMVREASGHIYRLAHSNAVKVKRRVVRLGNTNKKRWHLKHFTRLLIVWLNRCHKSWKYNTGTLMDTVLAKGKGEWSTLTCVAVGGLQFMCNLR